MAGTAIIAYYYTTSESCSDPTEIACSRFLPVLKLVGITNTVVQTGINAGLTSVREQLRRDALSTDDDFYDQFTVVTAMFGLWLTQHINRRTQLLGTWVAVLCANIGLTVCTAMYVKTGNTGAGIGAVVFVWLYNGAFFGTSLLFLPRSGSFSENAMVSVVWKYLLQYACRSLAFLYACKGHDGVDDHGQMSFRIQRVHQSCRDV